MTPAADRGRRAFGRAGEEAAASYLREHGLSILNRNYYTPFGELDIVAAGEGCLVFVEVKSARAGASGDPRLQFTPRKVGRMYKAALAYLEKERPGEDVDFRFDFVVVVKRDDAVEVEHYVAVPLDDYLPPAREGDPA